MPGSNGVRNAEVLVAPSGDADGPLRADPLRDTFEGAGAPEERLKWDSELGRGSAEGEGEEDGDDLEDVLLAAAPPPVEPGEIWGGLYFIVGGLYFLFPEDAVRIWKGAAAPRLASGTAEVELAVKRPFVFTASGVGLWEVSLRERSSVRLCGGEDLGCSVEAVGAAFTVDAEDVLP